MKIRLVAMTGVAVFALVGILAGCATKTSPTVATNSTPTASPSPSVSPKDALLASAQSLASASYHFNIHEGSLTAIGSADGANDLIHAAISGQEQNISVKMDMIVVQTDLYMKLDFGRLNSTIGIPSDKYLHMDATKVDASSTLPFGTDKEPADIPGLMSGLIDVKTTDGRSYSGTIDLNKATGYEAANMLQKAGGTAKPLPFTATLDDHGRLTDLTIDASSGDPGLDFEATFSDFGGASGVTAPDSSQVVEASDAIMKMFQGS